MRSATRFGVLLLLVGQLVGGAASGDGFQLNRYEPTAAGQWMFAVEHPWYSSTRWFAGGVTLDYGHNPLVVGVVDGSGHFSQTGAVVGNMFVGHLDLAGSFLDRVTLTTTVPLTLVETGLASSGVAPLNGVQLGDPRVGALIRIYHHADRDAFSLHGMASLWIPIGANAAHQGDVGIRVLPKLVAAGLVRGWLRWSLTGGVLFRFDQSLGSGLAPGGNTVGSELQVGAAVGYGKRTFHVGVEATLATGLAHFFDKDYTGLDVLFGGQVILFKHVLAGLALGFGALREPGTPDFRLLFRLGWAPLRDPPQPRRLDSDGDGVFDDEDACPTVQGVRTADRRTNGCPPPPPPLPSDKDRDGVLDGDDLCPEIPMGEHPDPQRRGCPRKDSDGDGVFDPDDACVDVPQGQHPDPKRPGCPDKDSDGDGVFDAEDACPAVPAGTNPDPARRGCPRLDRDGDTVPDDLDACPDKPGAPNVDPKKNGCPGLVVVRDGQIVILTPVYFATNKDVILKKSFAVLQAVASALSAQPGIRRVAIEGHTDNRGRSAKNIDLSDRRARSVMRFLVDQGIGAERLEAKGHGPNKPIMTNNTNRGRAANRRVEFRIVDPAPPEAPSEPMPLP